MKKFSNIEFYFPDIKSKSKEEITKEIVGMIKQNQSLSYCGFADEKTAIENIYENLGGGTTNGYSPVSGNQKKQIEKIVENVLKKSNEFLKIPTKQYIFVLPYFPNKSQKVFNGVYGYAVYSCVFYLFVDLKSFSKKSLENTVVHELNHTIYFYRHFDGFDNYTLLDNLILEGLAENFRKDVLGGVLPPWTKSLDKTESMNILSDYTSILMSKDLQLINDFLFGSKKFKKWTGYSAGFHLVREFIKCNPNFSWEKIMKTKIKEFQKIISKKNRAGKPARPE